MFRSFPFALASILLMASARAAEPKDLAELFPAGTLAYAEIGQPSGTSDSLAEFVKGTMLADSLGHSHDRRDKRLPTTPLQGLKTAGDWTLLTSPEMLAEFKRVQGIAAAVTGFDAKTGRPSLAMAIVLGDGNLAGFLARKYLLTSDNIRRVGKVDGIPVYQNRGLTGAVVDENNKPEPNDDPTPAQGLAEATYLYAPGLFVIGSNVAAVRDVYRRFAGTEKSANFGASSHLKPHADARKKPGIFFCADAAAFELQLNAARKVSNATWMKSGIVAYIRFLAIPKHVESFAGSWQLQPDGWALSATAVVAKGGASPLLALLTGGEANAEGVRGVPADSTMAFTVALPAKEKRAKAILDLADAVGLAMGHVGALPSELAAEAQKMDFKLSGQLLSVVKSATLAVPNQPGDPKAKPVYPLVILTLDDGAAAKAWLGNVPRVSQMLSASEKQPDPASETIRAVKVYWLVHASTPIHYAVAGSRLILGRDRDAVANCATLTANPWPKPEGQPAAVIAVAFSRVWDLVPVGRVEHSSPNDGIGKSFPIDRDEFPLSKQSAPDSPDPRAVAVKDWNKALAAMPPVWIRAETAGQNLTIRVTQTGMKKPLAKWLELLWQNIEQAPQHDQSGRINGGILQLDEANQFRGRLR